MTISNPIIRIVDDEAVVRKALKFLLESEGWTVEAYEKGSEFLVEDRPSLIGCLILDVAMPEMNGLEATKAIRDSGRPDAATVPVIAMTADVFKEDIRRCREAGMDAHIGKPVELDKLFSTLQRFLNNQQEPEEI